MKFMLLAKPLALLAGLILLNRAAPAQILSIGPAPEDNLAITGNTPANEQSVLQASANLNLWIDLTDALAGQVSRSERRYASSRRFFRLAPWAPASSANIVILGDSTVADFASNQYMVYGWGNGIYGFFKSTARVINLAYPGYSSKSFLNSDEKDRMMAIKPKYVLIEFGLIDEFAGTVAQATTLEEFEDNLKTIVQLVRSFNGVPVLIVPQVERYYDSQGKIAFVYLDRMEIVRKAAAELQTDLVDLNLLSAEMFNKLGKAGAGYIWAGGTDGQDYLHFTEKGAVVLSHLVVNALPKYFGPYLTARVLEDPPGP